jgi:hypothetical protein
MALSAAEILNKTKRLQIKEVEIPEWDGTVFVREFTAEERDQMELAFTRATKSGTAAANLRGNVAVTCLCDENGERIFTDADAAKLKQHSAAILDRIFDACLELSGMGKNSVEEAEKN